MTDKCKEAKQSPATDDEDAETDDLVKSSRQNDDDSPSKPERLEERGSDKDTPNKLLHKQSETFKDKQRRGLVRSSSSPALVTAPKSNSVGESGLSDVSQVLFSTKNQPADPKPRTSKPNAKSNQEEPCSSESHVNCRKNHGSRGIQRRKSLPVKRDKDSSLKTTTPKRNTYTSARPNSKLPPKSEPKTVAESNDLLSRFKTYNDQLVPASERPIRYGQLAQHSPSVQRGKRRVTQVTTKNDGGTSGDGVQLCSIPNSNRESQLQLRSPESQLLQSGLSKRISKPTKGSSPSSPRSSNQSYPRSIVPLLFDIHRIAAIMFSTASLVSRAFVAFGGKMPLYYYILNSPMIWILRWNIAMFHVLFILVELDIGIPILLPRGTLDSFLQKGHLVQFIGLLDLVMNSNKSSLVDTVNELRGEGGALLSARSIRLRCAYAILGISSRGLAACGFIYMLLGILGYTGESRRRLVAQARGEPAVGLAKRTPTRKRQMSSL